MIVPAAVVGTAAGYWNRVADSVDFVTAAECTGTAYADCLWQCWRHGTAIGFLCDELALWDCMRRKRSWTGKKQKAEKRSCPCGQCGTDSML